ncbi:putative membrane protein YesL [Peribacillus huizhouensis]|uniref:Membrane protein YesL n=2 Tax=Peribacillus huizhouensis TaxID=1501239 RepID=A0ABR6CTL6_9BACI|nr:putative membrane protein YesL [Peribacillus huizhouensis]
MGSTRLMSHVNTVCDWVIRLLYLNFLWFFFTIVGLVIAGIFPATVALFSVLQESFQKGENVRVFKRFWNVYKREFRKANVLGIIIVMISIIFYTDWLFTNQVMGTLGMIAKGILLGSCFVYGITLLYVIPVYLHVNGKLFTTMKLAFLIGITYPQYTFFMLLSIVSIMLVSFLLPMAGYLFFISGIGSVLMYFSIHVIKKVEERQKITKPGKSRLIIHN